MTLNHKRGPKEGYSFSALAAAAAAGGFVGAFLSRNFFESEKKITHEIKTDYAVGEPQFKRSMSQMLGPPLLDGNSVVILENGVQIFPAMLAAIGAAKRTIALENFVFSE